MNSDHFQGLTSESRRKFGLVALASTATIGLVAIGARASGLDLTTAVEYVKKAGGRVGIAAGNYVLERPLIIEGENFELFCEGIVTISYIGNATSPLKLVNCRNVSISGLKVSGNKKTLTLISIEKSKRVILSSIEVRSYMQTGIQILESEDCVISGCTFNDALIDTRWKMPFATDVVVLGGRNKAIKIEAGIHRSGGGYGIAVRTNSFGEKSIDHIILNNDINGYNSYGIMLYRNGSSRPDSDQEITGVSIIDNKISNISGARSASPEKPEVKDFGAGIYVQGAEDTLIERNYIDNTNIDTTSQLLAPGCIGLASSGSAVIRNNIMSRCKFGLYINDSVNLGKVDGAILAEGNIFRQTSANAVKIVAKDNVILNNSIYDQSEKNFLELSGGHGKKVMNRIIQNSNIRR